MAVVAVTPIAMLFVRCKGGVSHHPDEAVTKADVAAALDAYEAAVLALAASPPLAEALEGRPVDDRMRQLVIEDLHRARHGYGLAEEFDGEGSEISPACGDTVTVRVSADGFSWQGNGCTVSMAAASRSRDTHGRRSSEVVSRRLPGFGRPRRRRRSTATSERSRASGASRCGRDARRSRGARRSRPAVLVRLVPIHPVPQVRRTRPRSTPCSTR